MVRHPASIINALATTANTAFYRWMKKAKKVPNTNIATLNELYAFIQTMPDHIDYDWFIKHMNLPRKHYHSAMKKILDLAREYQSTL